MSQLSSSPAQQTNILLERAKSFSLGLSFVTSSGEPIDITGSTTRLKILETPRYGSAVMLTKTAVADGLPVDGRLRLDLQASDLNLVPRVYLFAVVMHAASGYSGVIAKGELEIVPNGEIESLALTYPGVNPSQTLEVILGDNNEVTVTFPSFEYPRLVVGSVTTVSADTPASVNIRGRYPVQILDLAIPRGVAELDFVTHLADAVDAHDASAISFVPTGTTAATTAQAAIVEVAADAAAELAAHLADAVDAHDATAVSYAGGPGLVATTVEGALDELATEKLDVTTASATYGTLKSTLRTGLPRQRQPKPTVVTAFQSGHGWTTGGTGVAWNLNDTVGAKFGTQCVSALTGGTGGQSWVQSPAFTAVDMTNMDLTVWVEVTSNIEDLLRIMVVLTGDNFVSYFQGNGVYDGTWPSTPVRPMRQGEIYPLRFNFQALTNIIGTPNKTSISRIRLTIQDKTAAQVGLRLHRVDYHQRPATFPTGVVSMGFDDSAATHYTRAFPTLSKYGQAGTLYLIKSLSEGAGLSVAQIQEMQRYGWEGAGHATTVDRHTSGTADLAIAGTLEAECQEMKAWLADIGASGADHFAYPRGFHSAASSAILSRYFATARTVYDNPQETVQPAAPMLTRALTMGVAITPAAVLARVDAAIANGTWLQLIFHEILATGATGSGYNVADLDTICAGLATRNIPVLPTGDVWRAAS